VGATQRIPNGQVVGEVKPKPETIKLPHPQARDGRAVLREIFDLPKNWECPCGKYKRVAGTGGLSASVRR